MNQKKESKKEHTIRNNIISFLCKFFCATSIITIGLVGPSIFQIITTPDIVSRPILVLLIIGFVSLFILVALSITNPQVPEPLTIVFATCTTLLFCFYIALFLDFLPAMAFIYVLILTALVALILFKNPKDFFSKPNKVIAFFITLHENIFLTALETICAMLIIGYILKSFPSVALTEVENANKLQTYYDVLKEATVTGTASTIVYILLILIIVLVMSVIFILLSYFFNASKPSVSESNESKPNVSESDASKPNSQDT